MAGTEPKAAADSRALRIVCEMPLISARELAVVQDIDPSNAWRQLRRLERELLIEGADMGATFDAARRYRLTPAGTSGFLEPEVYFHLARQVNMLASRLPAVEWFYTLVSSLPSLATTGKFRSFHWRFKEGVDALVLQLQNKGG